MAVGCGHERERWKMSGRIRAFLGVLFVIVGGLVLLDAINILPGGTDALWAAVFMVAGLAFLYFFFADRTNYWWSIIPGLAILGIAFILTLNLIFPTAAGELGGAVLLLGIAMAFWVIYIQDRSAWWPVIPAGILTWLGILIALSALIPGEIFAGTFLIGIGLTFILIYFLQDRDQRQNWMFYPGGILIGIGLILIAASTTTWLILLPAGLILAGAILIYRVVRGGRSTP